MLRAFVELVLNVASTFRMKARRVPVNATPTTPLDLPQRTTDTHQETNAAQQSSSIALILRSAAKLRVSKDEGVLTTPSVSHAPRAIHLPQRYALMEANRAPMRATKGNCLHHSKSGGGGSPRLRGETEGARATRSVPHLHRARANTCACQPSPARGRTKTAPINARANKNAAV